MSLNFGATGLAKRITVFNKLIFSGHMSSAVPVKQGFMNSPPSRLFFMSLTNTPLGRLHLFIFYPYSLWFLIFVKNYTMMRYSKFSKFLSIACLRVGNTMHMLSVVILVHSVFFWHNFCVVCFPFGSVAKNPPAVQETQEAQVWSLGLGRSPRGGSGNPLQYSCWENPVDRGAWWATVHGVAKSWTWLSTHVHGVIAWWMQCFAM